MKKLLSSIGVLAILTLVSFQLKENTLKVKDYLNIPGPLELNKATFNLSWSDHPNDNYYKQEYIPATEKSETFTKMIMVEAVVGNINLAEAVKAKINELQQRKRTDAVTNYQLIENKATGEYLLDFVISQPAGNKTAAIVEWNAYRYMPLKDQSGKKGIMLFAYCKRGYGDGSTSFLTSLKTQRVNDINNFVLYKAPAVKIDRP